MLEQRAQESRGVATCRRNEAATRACGARPAWENSTYVVPLFILTYMLAIMSQTSFPQAYSLRAIYVSTALPWRTPHPLPTPCSPHSFSSLCLLFCSHVSRPYVKLAQTQDETYRSPQTRTLNNLQPFGFREEW